MDRTSRDSRRRQGKKRIVSMLLAAGMALSLCACAGYAEGGPRSVTPSGATTETGLGTLSAVPDPVIAPGQAERAPERIPDEERPVAPEKPEPAGDMPEPAGDMPEPDGPDPSVGPDDPGPEAEMPEPGRPDPSSESDASEFAWALPEPDCPGPLFVPEASEPEGDMPEPNSAAPEMGCQDDAAGFPGLSVG